MTRIKLKDVKEGLVFYEADVTIGLLSLELIALEDAYFCQIESGFKFKAKDAATGEVHKFFGHSNYPQHQPMILIK